MSQRSRGVLMDTFFLEKGSRGFSQAALVFSSREPLGKPRSFASEVARGDVWESLLGSVLMFSEADCTNYSYTPGVSKDLNMAVSGTQEELGRLEVKICRYRGVTA
ncbi:hypothetical protein H671_3g8587 [Cricetulus griseus]|uniref:Uncharacterized protein n=1 Tax=Cricetulus griseus TaxID=10029 RepID=A0A061IBL0_CRIGR|nr:hypothetical protein H671_3g8587 [Cricetulus griseus]